MSGVQSIERAFSLLRALAVGAAGVTDLADRVDLPKSTVSRILSALEEEGVVEQLESGGEYRLGPAIADLAGASAPGRNLVAAARPFLIDLTELTNETSGISVMSDDGTGVYYLDHFESDDQVQVRNWTGEMAPLHTVPSGLVLLAHTAEDEVDRYLSEPLEQATPNTVVDPDKVRARLAEIRELGFAWVFEEFAEGINSVAAVVNGADGLPEAALHIHGPAYRFPDDDVSRYGRLVMDAAHKLSAQLVQ